MGTKELATYTFYFMDGTVHTGEGTDVGDAFSRLGFGHDAIATVDIFEEAKQNDRFVYNKETKSWDI